MIKPRICILLNDLDEFDFAGLVDRFLPADKFKVDVVASFPPEPTQFEMIVPWSYRRVIKPSELSGNVIVLHSSPLPEGRGFSPIYYAFSEEKREYVISAIRATIEVDAGDIIAQVRFRIEASYTAPFVRKLDQELSMRLIVKLLEYWPDGKVDGIKQKGVGSYRNRRYPKDSELDVTKKLETLVPCMRGVEPKHPAFFYYNKVKYFVQIWPENPPNKPAEIFVNYPALNKKEIWDIHDSP